MAFQQLVAKAVPFQSTPLVYPNAYWVATFDRLDKVAQVAVVKFLAYADKATREAGNVQPIDTHSFTVTGSAFNTYFSPAATTTLDVYEQAYVMAKVTADSVSPARLSRSGGGSPPVPDVFFAAATNV